MGCFQGRQLQFSEVERWEFSLQLVFLTGKCIFFVKHLN